MEKFNVKIAKGLLSTRINITNENDNKSMDFKPRNNHQKQQWIKSVLNDETTTIIGSIETLKNVEKILTDSGLEGIYYLDSNNNICLYNLTDYVKQYKKVSI